METQKCQCRQLKEARVHVIYTGGTIGMMRNEAGVLVPIEKELPKRLREYPNCHDKTYTPIYEDNEDPPLVLPAVEGAPIRVVYDITEYTPLLDSSCMGMNDWKRIASDIGECYERYDGLVILHGTDTMAYTASALAFMLENLGKPVVITGAQIPIFEMRTDGRDNFIGSLVMAGNYNIPEVLLYFDNKVLRGCRTTKISSKSFHAFDSPNQPPLGTIGVNVEINHRQIFRPCDLGKFSVEGNLENNVGLLKIYPGINAAVLRAFLSAPMKGVVIQSFGSGNIPNQPELLQEVREAVERGVLVVNITQCLKGSVVPIYETGAWMEMGVVAGSDMTPEAALAKLSYVLGKDKWNLENKKKIMHLSIRGELTTNIIAKINDIDLIEGVARTLHLSSCKERDQMCSTFFPALVDAAVREGNVERLKALKEYGANLCDTNCEGRTALHLSCYLGQECCVTFLLDAGCPVDLTDRFNRTPLHEAIDSDNHKVIKILLESGALLQDDNELQAEQLRVLAEHGQIERLESYRLAGANLTLADRTGRTPLHYASQLGNLEVVEYLLPFYCDLKVKDELGLGPIHYAKAGNHDEIVAILCERIKNNCS
ncbi:L-asparaginase 1 [Drosophila innubila]|uniref:L-asparaginase 1 n=1 Tax=Drosophila innubila TaxID=198719 RepID=UPI00148E77A7|nr:L-asparaginase 1 [Drosophila innubila]